MSGGLHPHTAGAVITYWNLHQAHQLKMHTSGGKSEPTKISKFFVFMSTISDKRHIVFVMKLQLLWWLEKIILWWNNGH